MYLIFQDFPTQPLLLFFSFSSLLFFVPFFSSFYSTFLFVSSLFRVLSLPIAKPALNWTSKIWVSWIRIIIYICHHNFLYFVAPKFSSSYEVGTTWNENVAVTARSVPKWFVENFLMKHAVKRNEETNELTNTQTNKRTNRQNCSKLFWQKKSPRLLTSVLLMTDIEWKDLLLLFSQICIRELTFLWKKKIY